VQYFGEPREKRTEIFVPQPSLTQMEVYRELYKLCHGDNRFDGPILEYRVSRCSLDISFIKNNVQKIAYEIDGKDHDKDYDQRRDGFLLNRKGWRVFRVSVKTVDELGADKVADTIYNHLLYQFGYTKVKFFFQWVIEDYNATKKYYH
jgi:hypothetical protein